MTHAVGEAGPCNLQISAPSSLTPGSPSGTYYRTTLVLLDKQGVFLISALSQHRVATAACGMGRIQAVSMKCGPLYLTCKAVRVA